MTGMEDSPVLRVENANTLFTSEYHSGDVLRIPVAHGEGRYVADPETLHAISHWVDADTGGRSTDPAFLTIFAAVMVAGLVAAELRR